MIPHSSPAAMPSCLICNAPLSPDQARVGPLCGRGECEWRYALLQRQHRLCVVCGRPLSPRELPARVCSAVECQRTVLADYARRVQEANQARAAALLQQEVEQAVQLRDRILNTFGLREPASFPLVLIPACTLAIATLPRSRRRALRDHLAELLSRAAMPPDAVLREQERTTAAVPVAVSPVQTVLGMACSCCKGRCCEGGGDHAYLKIDTLRRYLAEHPDQRPRDALAAYLARVGHRSYRGSCIYHQADGCALPPAMRSETCNRHYCQALWEFQRNLPAAGGPIRAFFVAANNGAIHAAALVHENQMLRVARTW